MTWAGTRPTDSDAPSLRALAAEGIIGAVALYFLVRLANGGINANWWICLAIFGVSLVSFIRTLGRAWSARSRQRSPS